MEIKSLTPISWAEQGNEVPVPNKSPLPRRPRGLHKTLGDQTRGVQPQLCGAYDTQSGVGGASGGGRYLESGLGAQGAD